MLSSLEDSVAEVVAAQAAAGLLGGLLFAHALLEQVKITVVVGQLPVLQINPAAGGVLVR